MKKNHHTPTCKQCRKRLIRQWEPIDWMDRHHGGKEPFATKTSKKGTKWETVEGWWGGWGRDGEFFCSLSCGYRWAIAELKSRKII